MHHVDGRWITAGEPPEVVDKWARRRLSSPLQWFLSRRSPWTERLHQPVPWFLRDISLSRAADEGWSLSEDAYPPLRPQPPVREVRRPIPWAPIVAVAALAVAAVALLIVVLGQNPGSGTSASPGQSAVQSAVPSGQTAAPSHAASAAPSETGAAPSGPSAPTFAADDVVALTVDALTLRASPGLDGEVLWRLAAGTLGFVIGGPVEADGYAWYQMSGMGVPFGSGCVTPEPGGLLECPAWLGWAAAADQDGTPWLEAGQAPACATDPPSVTNLSERPYTARLICFDDEEITIVAWWPELPEDAGLGGACGASDHEVGWLICQNINFNQLGAGPDESPTIGRWPVSIDPASGVSMPARGQWVEVTGHFDDPAAQQCGDAAALMSSDAGALVFECRLQFAVSSVAPAPAP